MFKHESRRAIGLAFLLVTSITFQSFAFTSVARAQKVKPSRVPATKPGGAPAAKPSVVAPAPNVPNLSGATKVDAWDDTATPDGKAEPGQTFTYTVTFSHTGPDPATGVTFTDSVDTTTSLVPGSVQQQPIATNDAATAFGNVRISTANGAVNLLANDCDPDDTIGPCNDNLTASGPATSANNGNVVVNADGTFSYNPFPGFTGTDTFTYTIRDKGPDNIANNSDDKTDTAVMTITVGPTLIWFIDNTAGGGGDGRLTSPYNSIAAFNAGAADDPGDIIFIYNGTGTYTGGITLLNTQKLIGQGFALTTETGAAPAGSDPLPAAGSTPTIDNANANIITLGQNNTLRGFNTGNSGTTGTDISGTSFGTLTASAMSLIGDGRALNLTTGTLAATFGNISASNTGSLAGLVLNAVGGSLTVSGNTTITNPGGNGIDISNAPAGTTDNFAAATVSKNAAGTAVNLATNLGTTSFTSLAVTNSSGAGIVTNNGGTLNVTTGSISTTGTGVAASFTNTTLGLTFTSVSSNGGANGLIFSGGSGSFTSGTTNLQNNAGIGLLMSSSAVVAGFGNTTVNSSAGDAVDLSSNTGNITFADLDMTPDAGLRGLDAQNNTGTITATSGDITTSGGATASAVFIDGPAGRTPINLTFTSVTTSGVGAGGAPTPSATIFLTDVSGTKFQVTGTPQINTRAGTGVLVNNSTATNIQLGTTNVPNPSAAGGYGIRVESSSSAVTVASATISDANIVTAQTDAGHGTPSNDGDGDAIFLKGNSGSFTLNGGTLSNCGNDCIDDRTSPGLTISGVTITNQGVDVAGSGLGLGGNGNQGINLTGTNSITGTTIQNNATTGHTGTHFFSTGAATATMTVQGTTFQNFTGNGTIGMIVSTTGSLTTNVTDGGPTNNVATNCTFTNIDGSAINFSTGGTATLNATVQRSTFSGSGTDDKTNVTGGNSGTSHASYNILNNTFSNVMLTASTGEGLLSFSADGTVSGNSFAMNMTGNTISGVGSAATTCGGGGTACLGPLNAILIFIDDAAGVPGTIIVDRNNVTNTQQGGMLVDISNNGPGSGSLLNGGGIHARTKANDNLSVTITGNTVDTSGAAPEMRIETNANDAGDITTPTMCDDVTGHKLTAGGSAVIDINEVNGTMNIEQASSAAVS